MNYLISLLRSKPVVLALGFALGAAGLGLAHTTEKSLSSNPPATLKPADAAEGPSKSSYAPLVKEVLPSVVNISSSKVVHNRMSSEEGMPMDPFFRQFFGQDGDEGGGRFSMNRDSREKALGSGIIVSPEGYILTTNHGVDCATDVRITLSDKRELKARIVGADPKTDVAVLKIDAK